MRLIGSVLCGLALLLISTAYSQEKQDPDGHESVLRALAEQFKDKRSIGQIRKDNALIRAAAKGDLDGVRKALQGGALINSPYLDGYAFLDTGFSGYTALMFAIRNRRTEAVKLLIAHKADLEIKDPEGRTALYLAVVEGQREEIGLLVKAGAKGDPARIRLSIDLIDAACKGLNLGPHEPFPPNPGGPVGDTSKAPDIANVLKKGADVNQPNPKGYTALMFAANLGLVENVKALLAHGADATRKSEDGETALSLAERDDPLFRAQQRRQVVLLLKAHLAKSR